MIQEHNGRNSNIRTDHNINKNAFVCDVLLISEQNSSKYDFVFLFFFLSFYFFFSSEIYK